jgi:hypothetical protein
MGYRTENFKSLPLSKFLVNYFFTIFITAFSGWVIIVHISGLIGTSFQALCIIYTFFLIATSFLLIKSLRKKYTSVNKYLNQDELHAILMLVVLASITSTVSLIAIRPDLDDVNYSSYAVYFLKNYSDVIDFKSHAHWLPKPLPSMPPVNISNTITLFCAYVAFLSGIPFLHVYYFFLPALTGGMIPLGWFLLFTKFAKKGIAAVIASTAICVFLSIDGEPHRSFGNFAFVRIWQGKAMLMSLVLPVFIAFTIEYFRKPTVSNWGRMFSLNCSAAGLSMMAVYFLPIAGFLIGLSCLSQDKNGMSRGEKIKSSLLYSMSFSYLLIIAAIIVFLVMINLKLIELIGFRGWPDSFIGQFKLIFTSYQFFLFIVFSFLCLITGDYENRKFLIVWIILSVIFFLNPIVFPFISKYITTLNTYWRIFYLLPFPFVIGLPITYIGWSKTRRKSLWWFCFILLISLAIIGNALNFKHATFSKLPLNFGQYKINKELEKDIRFIIKLCKPGPMLAPLKYSGIIPIYTADYPQVVVRKFSFVAYAIQNKLDEEANRRFRAVDLVSGTSKQGIDDIVYLINKGLMNIVIDSSIIGSESWLIFSDYLKNYNFKRAGGNDNLCVYIKAK